VLADNRSKFTPEMFGVYNAAPLVVIDGEHGVQRFGTLALYELPARLLRLLHLEHTGPIGLTAPQTAMHVRPIPGLHYLVSETGDVEVCREPPWTEDCARSSAWLNDVVTLGNDLFTGEKYTMRE
jgi:hypothetical protein